MKEKKDILKSIHASLGNGMRATKSLAAKKWLEEKNLSVDLTGATFNSGQLHHRKKQSFVDELLSVGFLTPSNVPVKSPELKAYTCFGREAIVFALKNEQNEVMNFYAIRINTQDHKTEYLNAEGLYPNYPHPLTERLYITRNVLDAATLLETRLLNNRDAVIALHDGKLKDQHTQAIQALKNLTEIILIP